MNAGVYAIRAENGMVKIGQTGDVNRRLQGLQAVSPMVLSLLHVIETGRRLEVERMLHDQFRDQRRSGEWFALSEDDIAALIGFEPVFQDPTSQAYPEPMTPQELKDWRSVSAFGRVAPRSMALTALRAMPAKSANST